MIRRTTVILLLVALFGVLLIAPTSAQDDSTNVVAEGLNSPRGLYMSTDGTLYIAEAGAGGPIDTGFEGPFGPTNSGASGRVSMVSPDGEWSAVLWGLPSTDVGGGEIVGPMDVYAEAGSMAVLTGQSPPSVPYGFSLLALDGESLRIVGSIDLLPYEATLNPDGDAIDSNPSSIAASPDVDEIYVADAGCNCIWSIDPDGNVSLFHVWEENPVPTSIDFGTDNESLYVSFLSPGPFFEGSARVEQWSTDGELMMTWEGLTLVTTVIATDSGVYAVEFGRFNLEAEGFPWVPGSGRVLQLAEDGSHSVVAEGLNFPYGIAQGEDGTLYVSVNSAYGEPGSGMVIALGME